MSSENISSSKKFQVKRERGGDECALIKIRSYNGSGGLK